MDIYGTCFKYSGKENYHLLNETMNKTLASFFFLLLNTLGFAKVHLSVKIQNFEPEKNKRKLHKEEKSKWQQYMRRKKIVTCEERLPQRVYDAMSWILWMRRTLMRAISFELMHFCCVWSSGWRSGFSWFLHWFFVDYFKIPREMKIRNNVRSKVTKCNHFAPWKMKIIWNNLKDTNL